MTGCLFHESVKQMKQVKQDFQLINCLSVYYEKQVKQNETKDKSVSLYLKNV